MQIREKGKFRTSIPVILTLILISALAFVGGCQSSSDSGATSPTTQTSGLTSVAVRQSQIAVGDSVCPYGGITVETGIDKNSNGVLDDSEVDQSKTQKVCNGAPGAKGDTGATGGAGNDGSSGSAGNTALASVTSASWSACPNGGKTISVGVDVNGNGVLDAGEVTSTFSVCNGGVTTSIATLISPETLKGWIDSGLVNGTGPDRIVVLDVQSAATYSTGHIPGALQVTDTDLYQVRQEGPAKDVNMVLAGAAMDALVQKYGIDNNTTIVFTGGSGSGSIPLAVTRAYFTFRYWGFPKEKLKFLDGVNFAWKAAYSMATGPSPTVAASIYSVKSNASLRTDLRDSLSDMIAVAAYGALSNDIPVETRTDATAGSYAGVPGSTPGVFNPGSDYVVFEGRIKGAPALNYNKLFDSSNNYRFKTANDLAALFLAIGIDPSKKAHVY
jgi:3-mercaptopyruvate sulfurtransferase SseA